MSDQSNIQLSDQAIQWLQAEGFTLHLALMPKIQTLHMPGSVPGSINPSLVQVAGSIRSRGNTKSMASEFVRNTRAELEELLNGQFLVMKKEVLDQHFKQDEDEKEESP